MAGQQWYDAFVYIPAYPLRYSVGDSDVHCAAGKRAACSK